MRDFADQDLPRRRPTRPSSHVSSAAHTAIFARLAAYSGRATCSTEGQRRDAIPLTFKATVSGTGIQRYVTHSTYIVYQYSTRYRTQCSTLYRTQYSPGDFHPGTFTQGLSLGDWDFHWDFHWDFFWMRYRTQYSIRCSTRYRTRYRTRYFLLSSLLCAGLRLPGGTLSIQGGTVGGL